MEDLPIQDSEFEEDLAVCQSDSKFDQIIGHIEEIIMEDDFQELQMSFMEKYYTEFDPSEENKFIYTDIHNEYVQQVESFLLNELRLRVPEFSVQEFQSELVRQRDQLEGEVFEMLLTFSDFMAFKEMILDYKADKEGHSIDMGAGLVVRSLSHQEPNGAARISPDLSVIPPVSYSSNQVHNLQIGSANFLICTPFVNSKEEELEEENIETTKDNELEHHDDMNVSPRPPELSPRDMDMS